MSNRKCFGTDGARGRIGDAPITPDFVLKLGWAAGKVSTRHGSRKIIIGKDTYISDYTLEPVLETDLVAADLSAPFADPVPILAVAYLTHTFRTEVGIMISASHNLFYDNGIKSPPIDSTKLPDTIEETIEVEVEEGISCVDSVELDEANRIVNAAGRYVKFCKVTLLNELSLSELKVMVDYASGTTYHIVPNMLRGLGVDVITIGHGPNGIDINAEMGAIDVRALQARMLTEKVDLGIVSDGDGDRVIIVDHGGNKVDGGQIMYITAREGFCQGQLCDDIVGISVSSMGLELVLKQLGTPFAYAEVSSCYILEKIQGRGWRIGAENSGHMILLNKTITGGGTVTDLQVLVAIVRDHVSLHDLCSGMKVFPQILVNVRYTASSGGPLEYESAKAATAKVEATLGSRGRVLLRKSGTGSLIRVVMEGEDEAQATEFARHIADIVKAV